MSSTANNLSNTVTFMNEGQGGNPGRALELAGVLIEGLGIRLGSYSLKTDSGISHYATQDPTGNRFKIILRMDAQDLTNRKNRVQLFKWFQEVKVGHPLIMSGNKTLKAQAHVTTVQNPNLAFKFKMTGVFPVGWKFEGLSSQESPTLNMEFSYDSIESI